MHAVREGDGLRREPRPIAVGAMVTITRGEHAGQRGEVESIDGATARVRIPRADWFFPRRVYAFLADLKRTTQAVA